MNISTFNYDQKSGKLSICLDITVKNEFISRFTPNIDIFHQNNKVNEIAALALKNIADKHQNIDVDDSKEKSLNVSITDINDIRKSQYPVDKVVNQTKFISRIDNHDTHGYYVRVPLKKRKNRNLKHKSKLFSDSIHAGKSNALHAAIAWRDENYYQEQGRPVSSRTVRENYIGKNKRDVGISRQTRFRRGRPYHYWVASYCARKGKQLSKEFSILEFGEECAKEMARVFRAKKVKKILSGGH